MCSRVLLLFYSLLAVPNANAKTARLHVAHTHLHEDFLLTLEESDVLQVFLTFSSFTTFTPVRAPLVSWWDYLARVCVCVGGSV